MSPDAPRDKIRLDVYLYGTVNCVVNGASPGNIATTEHTLITLMYLFPKENLTLRYAKDVTGWYDYPAYYWKVDDTTSKEDLYYVNAYNCDSDHLVKLPPGEAEELTIDNQDPPA